jgi:cold shock CspA family protein
MQGRLQTRHAEPGFGILQDVKGAEIGRHRGAVTPPAGIVTLAVGMVVEFEAEPGPTGLRATKVTIASEPRR